MLDKLYGSKTMDEDAINTELKTSSSAVVTSYLGKKYPDVTKSAAKKKFKELKGKELEEYGGLLPFDTKQELLVEGLKSKDVNTVRACGGAFAFLSPKEQMEFADADPAFFIANIFLPSHDSTDNSLAMLKNPKWRDILQKDPVAWKKLADTMPVLSVGEAAKKRVGKDDATPKELTEAIFDCVLENDGIELTYFTNPIDSDHALLGGPGEKDIKAREEQVANLKKQGYDVPDKPATQCHNLKGVVKQMVIQALGDKVKIEEDHIAGMLLTKPISGMPGGLLPNTFGGNVYDENDKLTGQAMFTGVGGTQSHTWLRIDGVDFDPVLGTRGAAVKAAKADEFTWIVTDLVGKGTKDDFIIKDPKLKPAPNKNGFGSAYRLTKDPTKYIQGIYGLTFEMADKDVKVKTVANDGPSADILENGDVILKVDGAPADGSKFYEYSVGSNGQKRVFEIRRGKKKMKLSVKAVSPIKKGA